MHLKILKNDWKIDAGTASFLGLGIKSIHFILNPQTAWLITPTLLFLTSAAAGGLAAGRISKLEAVEYMNE